MNRFEIIQAIIANIGRDLRGIRYALEDGEALAYIGVTDEDQLEVELAHTMVVDCLDQIETEDSFEPN